MKKLAIITLYDDINIGNKLQNYAAQTFFGNMGFECYTIRFWEVAHPFSVITSLKRYVCRVLGYPREKAEKFRQETERKRRFQEFSDKYLKLGEWVSAKRMPDNFSDQYDYFVAGSDQVWYNWTGTKEELDYFLLRFTEKRKRLTISPSFGRHIISQEFRNVYREGLLGFEMLTCREKAGASLIMELTGKKAEVLLDPTMLIPEKEWLKIEKTPDKINRNDNFILVYSLGNRDDSTRDFIKEISNKYSLKVVDIFNLEDKTYYLTTPDEFIYYIRHAELVITDSFHACVFSILFKRNFIVFDRKSQNIENMSSRMDTLLGKFGLLDRNIQYISEETVFHTDFQNVSDILEEERNKAHTFYVENFEALGRSSRD